MTVKLVNFFSILFFGVCLALSIVVVFVPDLLMRLLFLRKAADAWVRKCGTLFCRFVFWLVNVEIEDVSEVHPDLAGYPRVCFIANHTSLLDIPGMVATLGIWTAFIAKVQLFWVPLLNFWIEAFGCVPMRRGSLRASAHAINKGVEKIKRGTRMTIFPEGTRSKTGEIARFKSGSFKLATRSGALVVPVVIKGLRKGYENRETVRRQHAKIGMLAPIDTAAMTPDERRDLPERVENLIREAYARL